ncbi:MAG: hypothetical protein SFV51_16280 [Bryobacteraceae bacterium]|nr:hypothetical protein [Bryobacteraceae bacterium]
MRSLWRLTHSASVWGEIFVRRAAKILFLNGDPSLEFGAVANVIDIARGAGIRHCALMTARTPQ